MRRGLLTIALALLPTRVVGQEPDRINIYRYILANM